MMNPTAIATYWDAVAPLFDEEPDHGLRRRETREAWSRRLASWLPAEAALQVLDVGCGTGSLSELMAEAGHHVTGVDLSPRMIERARVKLRTAGLEGRFLLGDAALPPTGDDRFDVLLSRHLLWTLPDPQGALRRWVARLRPGGTLILVEGRWREAGRSGVPYVDGAETLPWHGGVTADELTTAIAPLVTDLRLDDLSGAPTLWGGPVTDERYALIARI
ncbi:methyltransferase domain-containing protein [Streptomyces sp. QHH-9511]|uniref:class I SAM-dependent methyltransferase n=1 Tax=Streptomyces sp. QHH-9511 TaxID=2684468 RepID=UPI001316008E|nr:class I SAM-dependent methyltransferase [Streptomyces sp. QHH-9511]QGZ52374.1 methyltransferase domain-containing protein [Streptomyces sp. QHH-9511]